jgi:3D (Asp-Asp-Asp) domain-containing protein
MRSLSKHAGSVFPVNHKNILGAILLSLILYALAGAGGLKAAKAGSRSIEALPITTEHLSPEQNVECVNSVFSDAHESDCVYNQPFSGKLHTLQNKDKTGRDSSSETASWQTVLMQVTAYCSCPKCCGKHSDGITASGHKIRHGDKFVAADKILSFGTEMIIPGYNNSQPVEVLDRGRVIRGNRLDVYFDSHKKALKWAVKYLPVKVKIR